MSRTTDRVALPEDRMSSNSTWAPLAENYDQNDNGKLDPRERRGLPDSAFAFTRQRELPLVDVEFVRAAVAEFGPVLDATDEECRIAAANIRAAAAHFGVEIPKGALAG
jgi:hypothetical protein